ncbi:hypothetical protein EPN87_00275 [archaeon]|nr:MAG: hypothetical protein EPN87_00275 [archaeon]
MYRRKALVTAGAVLYKLMPPAYRYLTKQSKLPLISSTDLGKPYHVLPSIDIPSNIGEKLLIDSVFPAALSAYLLEQRAMKLISGRVPERFRKPAARVLGASAGSVAWSALQYAGKYMTEVMNYNMPYRGSPFEPPSLFLYNLVAAAITGPLVLYGIEKMKERF